MQYEVMFQDNAVGMAQIFKEGLYYRIVCRVMMEQPGYYRLILRCEDNEFDLGLCVPDGKALYLNKTIPIKRLVGDISGFSLTHGIQHSHDDFVILNSQKPFSELSRLSDGKFTKRNGIPGILFGEDLNP